MKAVASLALRDLLTGRPQAGVVTAVFPAAAYAEVGGQVVAVVAADGIRLPNAMTLPALTATRPLRGLVPGAPARIGAGSLQLGAVRATVSDWWDPTVVCRFRLTPPGEIDTPPVEELARLGGQWPLPGDVGFGELCRGASDLQAALVTLSGVALAAAAGRLVGLGGGTTPAGDDLLAGALAGLRALDGIHSAAALAEALADAVRPHLHRTTSLSSALLTHAARGEAAEPVQAVLEALSSPQRLPAAVRRLLAVGHSSGRDLVAGMVIGGRVALGVEEAA